MIGTDVNTMLSSIATTTKSALYTDLEYIKECLNGTYTNSGYIDTIKMVESDPKTGIVTFRMISGLNISVSYRYS